MNPDVEKYLYNLKLRVASSTFTRKKYQLLCYIKHIETSNLSLVKKEDIENYLKNFKGSNTVRKQVYTIIKDFYAFTDNKNNPADTIKILPDKEKKLFNVPNQLKIESLINNISEKDDILSIRNRLIIELAYGSGIRRNELVRLNIPDINFEEKTVTVTGKGDKERIVPLTKSAINELKQYLIKRSCWKGPLLISFRGKRLTCESVNYIIKKCSGINPHKLRHACATHMLKNGCNIRTIQELLGHKSLSSTQIYTKVVKEDLREIINKSHPANRN